MKQRFANDEVLRYLANAVEAASKISDKKEASEKRVAALMKRADAYSTIIKKGLPVLKKPLKFGKNQITDLKSHIL